MRVRQLLERKGSAEVVTIPASADLMVAARLLIQRGIGGLPVVREDGALAGFLSERDVVRAVHEGKAGTPALPVEQIMRRPPPTCLLTDGLRETMSRMSRDRLRHLVVVDGGRAVGVLSVGDLVKHRIEELETETGVLRDVVVGQRARR
jgi:CBS domain-containing protein